MPSSRGEGFSGGGNARAPRRAGHGKGPCWPFSAERVDQTRTLMFWPVEPDGSEVCWLPGVLWIIWLTI